MRHATSKPATARQSTTDAEARLSRALAALAEIQRYAAQLAETTEGKHNTSASGFGLLAGLAGDALEGA